MKKTKFALSAITIGLLGSTLVQAAERHYLQEMSSELSVMSSNVSLASSNGAHQILGLSADESLQVVKTYADADGGTTVRYQQMYKGLPIFGDHAIISRYADNSFKLAHGAVFNGIAADIASVDPKISLAAAVKTAKAASLSENGLTSQQVSYENEQSALGIRVHEGKAQLVYQVSYVQYADEPSRPTMMIDAMTGEILSSYNNLQHAQVGTGPGGNQKTGRYEYGTDFDKMDVNQSGNTCTMQNTNVKTINLNHAQSGGSVHSFTCPENTVKQINGAYSPLNDAHFFGGVVYKMFNDYVGVPPLTFQLQMRVHYGNSYENAFWNGSAMTFGDGRTTFYPLVSLDVSAHEVAHGFTEQNSGLVYSGKSGGLNEAYSDMSGEAAEFFNNGTNDWLVGSQIFKGTGALRYMNNPTKDGRSIDKQSDYTSGMDVHHSSGVYNKAFYNLATTSGWDTKKAFQVYSKANQKFWTASTNWDQAGNGVLDAACELGFNVDQVKASLTAVGINSNPSNDNCGTTPPPPPGGDVLENGKPVTGLSAAKGKDVVYTMEVPAGASNVKFTISGGTGDADLYVKFGSAPTDTSYDCRPYKNGNSETCTGSQTGGTYYVRLKGYTAFSGVTLTGSYSDSTGTDPIDRTETISSLPRGQWARFTQVLPAGYSNLNVSISGGTGDADLYVRKGAESTTSSYDCRPYKNGNSESCNFNNPAADTWHIDVRGYSSASNVTVSIKATPSK
ncbi:M4 family metallopeptidase [Aliikangiella sp. IMCC44359]|uniref:M4 family metallopeptidase n=1 Tax=Aliikangiella sp. IMCC44359 TaxID=3459125 RepID=UPI00403AB1B0